MTVHGVGLEESTTTEDEMTNAFSKLSAKFPGAAGASAPTSVAVSARSTETDRLRSVMEAEASALAAAKARHEAAVAAHLPVAQTAADAVNTALVATPVVVTATTKIVVGGNVDDGFVWEPVASGWRFAAESGAEFAARAALNAAVAAAKGALVIEASVMAFPCPPRTGENDSTCQWNEREFWSTSAAEWKRTVAEMGRTRPQVAVKPATVDWHARAALWRNAAEAFHRAATSDAFSAWSASPSAQTGREWIAAKAAAAEACPWCRAWRDGAGSAESQVRAAGFAV